MEDKTQIHSSMLNMLWRCGEQFRRRYGARFGWNDKEEIIPPGVSLITGISTHKSIEANLTSKIQTGELLGLEAVKEIARDSANGFWQGEVFLNDEEAIDPAKSKGLCIDTTVALATLHAYELAPILEPQAIERKWVVILNGFPFDLAGQWDIEEVNGSIRDTKTASKSPSQDAANTSEQLTMYSMAKKVCDGKESPVLYLDTLVKTKEPKLVILKTERTESQRQMLLRRIERAAEIIARGGFTPCNSSDWICSKKFCGYARSCPLWSGK